MTSLILASQPQRLSALGFFDSGIVTARNHGIIDRP